MTETLKNNFPCVFGVSNPFQPSPSTFSNSTTFTAPGIIHRPSDPDQRITRMPSFAGFAQAAAQDSMFKVCEFATFLATIYTGGMEVYCKWCVCACVLCER